MALPTGCPYRPRPMIDRLAWDNSPMLRASIESMLQDWGAWGQGGGSNLGYPSHQPWATPPEETKERRILRASYDEDVARKCEAVISAMASGTIHDKGAWLLKFRYVDRIRDERKLAKCYNGKFQRSERKSVVAGRLEDAMWIFACLIE